MFSGGTEEGEIFAWLRVALIGLMCLERLGANRRAPFSFRMAARGFERFERQRQAGRDFEWPCVALSCFDWLGAKLRQKTRLPSFSHKTYEVEERRTMRRSLRCTWLLEWILVALTGSGWFQVANYVQNILLLFHCCCGCFIIAIFNLITTMS